MEEQTERKASATAVAEEPIKAEGTVETSDTSERSDGAASPPPNCSICLGKLVNTSFTDSCLHQFCFTCLLQWSKIKTECPLCKQTFKSIIHNVRSEEDYDQYHVPRELASQVATATLDVNFDFVNNVGPVSVGSYATANWDIGIRRFMYRYGIFSFFFFKYNCKRKLKFFTLFISFFKKINIGQSKPSCQYDIKST